MSISLVYSFIPEARLWLVLLVALDQLHQSRYEARVQDEDSAPLRCSLDHGAVGIHHCVADHLSRGDGIEYCPRDLGAALHLLLHLLLLRLLSVTLLLLLHSLLTVQI